VVTDLTTVAGGPWVQVRRCLLGCSAGALMLHKSGKQGSTAAQLHSRSTLASVHVSNFQVYLHPLFAQFLKLHAAAVQMGSQHECTEQPLVQHKRLLGAATLQIIYHLKGNFIASASLGFLTCCTGRNAAGR